MAFGCNLIKWNLLFHAVIKNRTDKMLQIFHNVGPDESVQLINKATEVIDDDDESRTDSLLVCAVTRKRVNVETLQLLLENGADPNKHRDVGGDALASACVVGLLAKTKMLVGYGANVNSKLTNSTENLSLYLAAFNDREDIGSMLVDCGADVNAVNVNKMTVLNYACALEKKLPFVMAWSMEPIVI
jgi:ankyrin repeat protein